MTLEIDQKHPPCTECVVGIASGTRGGRPCRFAPRRRREGEMLYRQGEPADRVWYIKSGTVAILSSEQDGDKPRARGVRFPGDIIGLESLVAGEHIYSARAVTDIVVCGATIEAADAWLGPKDSPARAALELTLRSNCSDRHREAPTGGSAVSRVATWLVREGPRKSSAVLPRMFVADLLGMRAETLSRSLAKLADIGAIEVSRKSLRIVDEAKLSEAAVFESVAAA